MAVGVGKGDVSSVAVGVAVNDGVSIGVAVNGSVSVGVAVDSSVSVGVAVASIVLVGVIAAVVSTVGVTVAVSSVGDGTGVEADGIVCARAENVPAYTSKHNTLTGSHLWTNFRMDTILAFPNDESRSSILCLR